MEVRKATKDDARAAFDIRLAAIKERCAGHYAPRDLELWTAGPMSDPFVKRVADDFYVATIDGTVVGTGMIDLQSGRVDAVFVHPSYMRRGIGRRVMSHLEQLAREAHLARMSLDATLNAASFYRSLGFVGDTVGRYDSQRGFTLDCIPMVKDLPIPRDTP